MDDFDLTLVNKMPVDHGLTVPLSLMFGQPRRLAVPGYPVRRQRRAISRRHPESAAIALGQAIRQGDRVSYER